MKTSLAFLAAPLAAALLSLPAVAQDSPASEGEKPDRAQLSCADFQNMDADTKVQAVNGAKALVDLETMSESDRAAMEAAMNTVMGGMTEAERQTRMAQEIEARNQDAYEALSDADKATYAAATEAMLASVEAACDGNPSVMVVDALKTVQ